jgi:ribosome maturation factor RimP
LEPLVNALGMRLIDFSSGRHKGSTQIRLTVDFAPVPGLEQSVLRSVGHGDCARVHQAVLPRLELAFPDDELYIEVSSPGLGRLIKDGSDMPLYLGRGIRLYRTDINDWTSGVLLRADSEGVSIKTNEGELALPFSLIAKAKLVSKEEDVQIGN